MRIIAGEFRGRRLRSPRGFEVRPTSDRLRETLFDILGTQVRDAVVLDGFAGTGAIGLEAISRGAREVLFIEQSAAACRLIRQNLDLCGLTDGHQVFQGEAMRCLRLLGRAGFIADFVFLDPPYRWQRYSDLVDILFRMNIVRPGVPVVLEHRDKSAVPEVGEGYGRVRLVRQGSQCLSFYMAEQPLED